jgi:ATP-dependent Clp protease protease subunit
MTRGYILGEVRCGDDVPPPPRVEPWRDGPTTWNDWARAAFFERRTVLLGGPLDDTEAGRIAAELMLLDASGDDPVELRIDSSGGSFGAALTLIDVVDLLGVPVHATCVGRAEGPSFAVLAVGDHRAAVPHARLRFCDDPTGVEGSATDVLQFAAQRRSQVQQVCERLAEATLLEAGALQSMLERRVVVAVDDARRLGFIDDVCGREARVLRFPKRIGFQRP